MRNEPKETRELLQVRIDGLNDLGEGLAAGERGLPPIPTTLPGEEVTIEIVSRKRRSFCRVLEISTPSPERILPLCPYFGECSGCQWQHVSYARQLEIKSLGIKEALLPAGIEEERVLPIISSPETLYYRNHARFTVREGVPGFVNRQSRHFVPVTSCLLMNKKINAALESLSGCCAETAHLSIRCGSATGEVLIQPEIKTAGIPTGQSFYHEVLSGHRFQVSAASFFQVNTQGAEKIIEVMGQWVKGSNLLVDSYAGVGTFSLAFSGMAEKVIAVEESSAACQDAARNLDGVKNVRLIKGKAEEVMKETEEHPDVVILDPPRAGCLEEMLQALLTLLPPKIVYVSCNLTTLVRDIKALSPTYKVSEVQPVDLFPYTYHMECVTVLEIR